SRHSLWGNRRLRHDNKSALQLPCNRNQKLQMRHRLHTARNEVQSKPRLSLFYDH
ncbi:hypothetical protein DPMN_153295, partial [Dreissena polymorpha]